MTNRDQALLSMMLLLGCTAPAMGGHRDHARGAATQLTIAIYNQTALPPATVAFAAAEADRALRNIQIHFVWEDCAAQRGTCGKRYRPEVLIMRILPHAAASLPASALGVTMTSDTGSSAAVFYDRALSLGADRRFLPQILGRAMAHEVVHMLLPDESHSESGLMRGQWSAVDLRWGSFACDGVTHETGELIERAAARRSRSASVQESARGAE